MRDTEDNGIDGVDMRADYCDYGGECLLQPAVSDNGGVEGLMDRVEELVFDAQNIPDSCWEEWQGGLADGRYDDEEENNGEKESSGEVHYDETVDQPQQDVISDDVDGRTPDLDKVHTRAPSYGDTFVVEGGADRLRLNGKAVGGDFYPFSTKEQLLVFGWQLAHQVSQKAVRALFEILLHVDEDGQGFDVGGLEGVDATHFFSRMRKYVPLLLVLGRKVDSTQEGYSSAVVYDVPVNLLIDRDMRLASETQLSATYPAGNILQGSEAAENSLSSDHMNCVPTVPRGRVMKSNMHGTLARSTPFFGIDGVKGIASGRKIYCHDVCMCEITGTPSPARVLELFWHEEKLQLMATVRQFRTAGEVQGGDEHQRMEGLLRVWEEAPAEGGTTLVPVSAMLDLCEIYTVEEVLPQARRELGSGGSVHRMGCLRWRGVRACARQKAKA